ncbi:MAG: AAA family ATPase [Vampirovibrio sp.]|nr:AAA family ATPase [Vampirovibrio sp.]
MKAKQPNGSDTGSGLLGVSEPNVVLLDKVSGSRPIENDLQLLIDILPERVRSALLKLDINELTEVVLDLGRVPEARISGGTIVELGTDQVSFDELNQLVKKVGSFNTDNRAGIPRTLHRISAIRNRQGEIIGLTCRVGKVVTGTIESIRDLIESGKSILMLGRPGVGKTTKLREVAKLLADEARKRVVIVDTSNEIAGDGDIPHPAVGRARRMQVSSPDRQKEVMIEAVENHTPEVIVVDEIGTEDESAAARTIAERGVILVATAHGSTLENLIKNPMLSDLVGGVQAVTLGDDEAKRRSTQKTVLEREKQPTFDIAVEIRDRNTLAIYPNVAEAVDHILRGWTLIPEVRKVDTQTGNVKVLQSDLNVLSDMVESEPPDVAEFLSASASPEGEDTFRVFLYGISKVNLERIVERLHLTHVSATNHIYDANAVIALKGSARPGSKIMKLAEDYEVPVFIAKTNTMPQIQRALRESMDLEAGALVDRLVEEDTEEETDVALREAREAAQKILDGTLTVPAELAPRRSYIRRLQHELVENQGLISLSVGNEPNRHLKILPPES